MKNRIKLLLLCLMSAILLCGCPADLASSAQAQWPGYSSPREEYTYYYKMGRNLEWEEDLIFFANSHFSDNQLLQKGLFLVELPGGKTDSAVFYDEELYQSVLTAVNALIPEIKDLSDDEILWRIQKIAAMFSDAHTSVYLSYSTSYPIFFTPMHEDGEWVFYAVVLPAEHEELLYTKLTAINGQPIDQVVDAMRSFISYENEYGLMHTMANGGYGWEYLTLPMALEATGISQLNDTQATYTLTDEDGNAHDLTLTAVESIENLDHCGMTLGDVLTVPFRYNDSENYWYTTELADSTLYVRISSFAYEEEENYLAFSGALTVESNATGHYDKVIVDLRGNGGGHQGEGWRAIINTLGRMDFNEFYLLVDGCTYSCSMLFASEVKYQIPEAIIAGTPTGEAPGFFASVYTEDYLLPNCGVEFTIPTQYYQTFEDNDEHALVPDLLIWPTIEDYTACRDAVLEYVLTQ